MTGLRNAAAASRSTWILSASSSCRYGWEAGKGAALSGFAGGGVREGRRRVPSRRRSWLPGGRHGPAGISAIEQAGPIVNPPTPIRDAWEGDRASEEPRAYLVPTFCDSPEDPPVFT